MKRGINILSNYKIEEYSKIGNNNDYIKQEFLKIKEILEKFETSFGDKIKVFLQGSYKNNTNINSNSDIDIVAQLYTVFMSNIGNSEDNKKLNFSKNFSDYEKKCYDESFDSTTKHELFKNELFNFLNNNLQKENVSKWSKTIKCKIKNSTFTFDIVPAIEYRFYKEFINKNTKFIEGNAIYNDKKSQYIINFPKQTYKNSIKKMELTDFFYKRTVRIFKNIMHNDIKDEYLKISSFALESILYNVENNIYKIKNDNERVLKICLWVLFNDNKFNSWKEPNEILLLNGITTLGDVNNFFKKIISLFKN